MGPPKTRSEPAMGLLSNVLESRDLAWPSANGDDACYYSRGNTYHEHGHDGEGNADQHASGLALSRLELAGNRLSKQDRTGLRGDRSGLGLGIARLAGGRRFLLWQ